MIAQMMRRSLLTRCTVVDVVVDGRAAVKAALEGYLYNRPYAVVLMDMHMPVMDGATAIRALRQAEYRGVIIAVTAGDDETHHRQAINAGADDFVIKPVEWSELYAKMRRLTGAGA